MNENENEKCSLLLFVTRCYSFWFLGCVSICHSLPFAALRRSSCFLNQFYLKNQNRQMPLVSFLFCIFVCLFVFVDVSI